MNVECIFNKCDFSVYSLEHKKLLKDELIRRICLRKTYRKNPELISKLIRNRKVKKDENL